MSNIYTVLLLVSALALIIAVTFVAVTLQKRYGSILPAGQAGERTERALQEARTNLSGTNVKLEQGQQALDQFLGGGAGGAATPAAGTEPAPATEPAPETESAAPAAGAAPAGDAAPANP